MEQQKHVRRVLQPLPSKWTGYFIDAPHMPCMLQPEALIKERRDELVKKLRSKIHWYISNKKDLSEGMRTVDAIERLGVGYHFEEEIAMFMEVLSSTSIRDSGLAGVALRFRLLRQHRYNIPCDMIGSFKEDKNGNFTDALRSDVDALLSLYEAAHHGNCDEDYLNEAVVFTANCLSSLVKDGKLPGNMLEKIQHALTLPTQRRMKRLEAKLYISIYEKDNGSNQDILELAKLDFHLLQMVHRDEVKTISLWYKEFNHGSTLGKYIRERPVECYFWALGVLYQPQYAKTRIMVAKITKICALLDDTYDAYGTFEELCLFNQAVQSWDADAASRIGKCFGYVMSLLTNTLEEWLADGASPFGIDCTKEIIKKLSRCMLQEVIWRQEGQVPPFHEHLKLTPVSSCLWAMACVSCIGMGASDDVFTWIISYPKIMESVSTVSRLMDDIYAQGRGLASNTPNAVDCYVKEHGVTVEEAKDALSCLIEEHWRSINQEFIRNARIPVVVLTSVINLARVMESLYTKIDGSTHRTGITDSIENVLGKCVYH